MSDGAPVDKGQLQALVGERDAEIANMKQEMAKVRKNLIMQMTRSNDIVNSVRDIDSDYFGERFW